MLDVKWTGQAETLLKAIWTPELEPLFWRSSRVGVESSWYGHVPFARWLVRALAPRCIVELGTHNGVSYSAFCEAVQHEGLGTQCFAIDTWSGDEHAGFYGEDVYWDLRFHHDQRFSTFSTLLRRTFDDGLNDIADRSVDLLHIDGRHNYEDVRHDFEYWRCKMSERGVILFHDTVVRENNFGVWRFWSELQEKFPNFEFLHAHGLGLIVTGTECAPLVGALVGLRDPFAIGGVRERFAQLGERCVFEAQARMLSELAGKRSQENEALRKQDEDLRRQNEALRKRVAQIESERAALENGREEAVNAHSALLGKHLGEVERRMAAEATIDCILQSTTWRATTALRTFMSKVPSVMRRPTRQALLSMRQIVRSSQKELANAPIENPPPPLQQPISTPPEPALSQPQRTAPIICYIGGEPDTPGTIYRIHHYAAASRATGAHVTALRLDEVADQIAIAKTLDILVVWRAVLTEALSTFVEIARANGARVVFDVDDLMIDPSIAKVDIIDGIRSQNLTEPQVQEHYAQMQRTMLAAEYCTASTAELAGHMRRFAKTSILLPNGFDADMLAVSRMAARRRKVAPSDGLLRIGYATGSRTHQRDFAEIAPVLPNVFARYPQCRLVLFQVSDGIKLIDLHEFPFLEPFQEQIEWRELVPLARLPEEICRFDVNLAPLQPNNIFCEAKSELKYFEAALAGVPTIASPVGPYKRAIDSGVNGYLALTPQEWEAALIELLENGTKRQKVAQAALNNVLWTYGPERRAQLMRRVIAEWQGGDTAADAFVLQTSSRADSPRQAPIIPEGEVVWSSDRLRASEVTVVIPLYNYAHTLIEALESVLAQTLPDVDLVIVDDRSDDASLEAGLSWTRDNVGRFNRVVVIRNVENTGLGPTRNAGFSAAETRYVLPLDADNVLRPACCELLLNAIRSSNAAFAYPVIREFGDRTGTIGTDPYHPRRFVGGNYIDAMALISKSAWSAVGGYGDIRAGWEDYDFWCAMVELGVSGHAVGGPPLADYRAHQNSMLAQVTDTHIVKAQAIKTIEHRHPWVSVAQPLASEPTAKPTNGIHQGFDTDEYRGAVGTTSE